MSATPPADSSPLEIVSTRVFPVSREVLFEAFRNPTHLAQWWGPKGFTNTIHEFDLRVGGAWRITLHGPDGTNYDNVKEFTEVVIPERVIFRHLQPMHDFTMALIYDVVAGGTRLTWRMVFSNGNENLRAFITAANEENFDRLEAYLPKLSGGGPAHA